jgi:hypothetical protein
LSVKANGGNWENDITHAGQRLAKTIEEVMNTMFTGETTLASCWEEATEFCWVFGVDCSVEKGQPVHIRMSRPMVNPGSL